MLAKNISAAPDHNQNIFLESTLPMLADVKLLGD